MNRWPEISISVDHTGAAEARLFGVLGHEVGYIDRFDARSWRSIRQAARWLDVPVMEFYDAVVQARGGAS